MVRAIKIISKSYSSKDDRKRLVEEIEKLMHLDHPNVQKIYEYY